MKLILRRLALVCSALLWGFGCQDKENAIPKSDSYTAATIDNQTQEEKYAYTEKHLTTIASGLAALQDNPIFLDLLYKEVVKETWGEPCALFSTLFKQAKETKINLYSLMATTVDVRNIEKSIFAFVGINNQVLYPQIFIPNFKERGNPSARLGSKSPVYVIFNGKSSPDSRYPAYGKDAKGNFVKLGFMVDEAYSLKNEVWVISLSEKAIGIGGVGTNKICADGQTTGCVPEVPEPPAGPFVPPSDLPPTPGPARICTIDGNPSYPHLKTDNKGIDVFIDRIGIGCNKETWVSGKSEVRVKVSTIWNTGYNLKGVYDLTYFWAVETFTDTKVSAQPMQTIKNFDDITVGDWDRKDVGNFAVKNVGTKITANWGAWLTVPFSQLNLPAERDRKRDVVVYVVYEMDPWPAPRQTVTCKTQGGYVGTVYKRNQMNMDYPSEQDPYVIGNFNFYQGSDNYACGEKYSDDCSKLEMVTRNPNF